MRGVGAGASSLSQARVKSSFSAPCDNGDSGESHSKEGQMDIHPWTKYEIARMRDEERLLRARAAMRAKEVRDPIAGTVETSEDVGSSLFGWLRRRQPVADAGSVRARPA